MLILVSSSRIVLAVFLVVGFSFSAIAQDTYSHSNPGEQKSILVSSGDSNPATTSGANGKVSIGSPTKIATNATFTARPQESSPAARMSFGDGPQPPSQMLTPEGPTEDTYTAPANQIYNNDLRSKPSVVLPDQEARVKGSDARGTFATTQESWQNQNLGTSQNPGANQSKPDFHMPQIQQFKQPPIESPSTSQSSRSPFGAGSQLAPSVMSGTAMGSSNPSTMPSVSQPMKPLRSFQDSNPQKSAVRLADGQANSGLGGIRPTGFTQPIPKKKLTTTLAKQLMSRYSVDNVSGALPGEPMKLVDMFRQPIDSAKRQAMVHHYWEAYYDWATFVSAQRHLDWLNKIPNVNSPAEGNMLAAAKLVAGNRVLASEIQLGKSQARLLQYMPNRASEILPLPEDTPLIQKYKTKYDAFKSNGMLPESLRGIDQMLPKTLHLIAARADAVDLSQTAAQQIAAGLQTRQTTVASVLEAGRIWRNSEVDLIASVVNYNQAIADYFFSITHGNHTPEVTAEALIGKPKPKILQASNQSLAPIDRGQGRSQSPPTSRVANNYNFGAPQRRQTNPPASQYGQQAQQRQANSGNFGPPQNQSRMAGQPGNGMQQTNNSNFGPPANNGSFGPPPTQIPQNTPNSGGVQQSGFGPRPPAGGGGTQFGPPIGSGR